MLRYSESEGQATAGAPVVFVPSLINPPQILDLSEERSMLRHLAAAGHDVHLIDWGTPDAQDSALGLDGHVAQRLVPLLATLPRPPILVGYCLGGTLALAAAMLHPVAAVATLAAPWNFAGYADADRQETAALWQRSKALCARLGYVPMEVLQSGFWAMDPRRTIRKYAAFADMAPGSEAERAFLAVEDWANAGPPLSFAAGRDLFELLYDADASGRGEWRVEGRAIDPAALPCPSLSIASSTDRIVPASAAPKLGAERLLSLGHVGMVIGGRAPELLWEPLSLWLSTQGG